MCERAAACARTLRPGWNSTTGLPRRARGGHRGEELGRAADLFAVGEDDAGGRIVGEMLDELGQADAGLVPDGDRIRDRHASRFEPANDMAAHPAALRDHRHARSRSRVEPLHPRKRHEADAQSVDVVGVAEAIGADEGETALARRGADLVLAGALVIAHLGEARGEGDGGFHLAPDAGGNRFADGAGRNREHGEVDVVRQCVDAGETRAPFDLRDIAPDEMNVAAEFVRNEVGEHHVAGGAGARGDADDRDRARPQQSLDGGNLPARRHCAGVGHVVPYPP